MELGYIMKKSSTNKVRYELEKLPPAQSKLTCLHWVLTISQTLYLNDREVKVRGERSLLNSWMITEFLKRIQEIIMFILSGWTWVLKLHLQGPSRNIFATILISAKLNSWVPFNCSWKLHFMFYNATPYHIFISFLHPFMYNQSPATFSEVWVLHW